MPEILRLQKVCSGYGNAIVLNDLSFDLKIGETMALLGRNGMGKTTLLATIMGATNLHSGQIFYKTNNISRLASHLRARSGIGWVSQERDIFKSLTVEENLQVTARPGYWNLNTVYQLFPRLQERKSNMGHQLSGGEQQMLAMGRALMLNPKLLLLDEPLEGLAPIVAQELLNIIKTMVSAGEMATILVEQHARQVLPISDKAIILERGSIVYEGSDLLDRENLLEQLLGTGTTRVKT